VDSKSACRVLCLAVLQTHGFALAQGNAERVGDATIAAEAQRRHDTLIRHAYNLTQAWSLAAHQERATTRFEVVVPQLENEHEFSFWAETNAGRLSFRLLGSDGYPMAAWSGRKGETTVSFRAPVGKYTVEIDQAPGTEGHALLGVKGPAFHPCELDGLSVREHAGSPGKGFFWPYLLFIPKEVKSPRLLVVPNNTGFQSEDLALLRSSGSCDLQRQSALAAHLGVPLLVPLFPRPIATGAGEDLYLHALTRASLETKLESARRVDLQLVAMIDDARAELRASHVEIESKVLLCGFSASGSFVSRFAMLHPDRVAAVASGSPGGWPLVPEAQFDGEVLGYPVGVADLRALVGEPLDSLQAKEVAWFFYLGAEDTNDAVVFRDSFSKEQEELIVRHFGKTPVSRWTIAEQLYSKRGFNARFVLYPGAAHSITPDMQRDISQFFEKVGQGATR
jgi:dienelactone hydrolase